MPKYFNELHKNIFLGTITSVTRVTHSFLLLREFAYYLITFHFVKLSAMFWIFQDTKLSLLHCSRAFLAWVEKKGNRKPEVNLFSVKNYFINDILLVSKFSLLFGIFFFHYIFLQIFSLNTNLPDLKRNRKKFDIHVHRDICAHTLIKVWWVWEMNQVEFKFWPRLLHLLPKNDLGKGMNPIFLSSNYG